MTKYYINYSKQETVAVPNPTSYLTAKMLQRGFVEVTETEWQEYVDRIE